MLRKIRIILAVICFTGVTLLFCDFTGATHAYLGWLAKVQLLPAILAGNAAIIAALVLLTLIFGRVYCSIICPLGVMQDIFAWTGRCGKKKNRFKYSWSPAKNVLRLVMLAVMIVSIVLGASALSALLAPYSAYGRIASQFLAPSTRWATICWQSGPRNAPATPSTPPKSGAKRWAPLLWRP